MLTDYIEETKFYSLKSDVIFKNTFDTKKYLKRLLEATLNLKVKDAKTEINKLGLEPVIIGDGDVVVSQYPVNANVNMVYLSTVLKIIGIAYIAEFTSQITKDAGQGAIASKIELAGKIMILTMAIPIITVIIESVIQMIPN